MRISILAIGRLSRGPEADLVVSYVSRATAVGRALGIGPVEVLEIDARKSEKPEGAALLSALDGLDRSYRHVMACDEHGGARRARALAKHIGGLRDSGVRRLAFLIGGADGLSPDALATADERLSFGPQTWPHALARVMLAEQIYRAATLLAGAPYHRD